ncbi:MAG TPA: hypothetical protein VFA53_02170 [Xanthobacteraceae bacterium]|nr:hypothetical protein [Xanthobacteraceae bacterium]
MMQIIDLDAKFQLAPLYASPPPCAFLLGRLGPARAGALPFACVCISFVRQSEE